LPSTSRIFRGTVSIVTGFWRRRRWPHPEHVRQNRRALDIELSSHYLRDLDAVFKAPSSKVPLEVI
jgi:diketogulonate reductase-like aldo/keto reductase